jgi:four helix bundle protein
MSDEIKLKTYSFEKLEAWKLAREVVGLIYKTTSDFPKSEMYGLTNQIRRAAISIPTNIAEGSGRGSSKDQGKFYQYAYSSTLEVINLVYLSFDLGFLNDDLRKTNLEKLNRLTFLINQLVKSLKS